MADEDRKYAVLVETYSAQHASIVEALIRALLSIWLPLAWIGRPDLVNAAAAASAVQVDAANSRARRLARLFMLRQLELLDAAPADLPPLEDMYPRSDVPIVDVYKRPARQVEHELRQERKNGEPWPDRITDEVMQSFENRLTSIVSDDLATTARDEQQKVMWSAPKVVGYRRLIHPEFSKTGTCGLCVVAATRFYTKAELMPLHDLCKCTISPITANRDLGLKLNDDDLKKIYEAGGSNYADDLKRIKVGIGEHGELGPIIVRDGTHFRGVGDVNRDSKRRKYTPYSPPTIAEDDAKWAAMKETSERCIRILEDARQQGIDLVDTTGFGRPTLVRDFDKAIEWHRSLIARARSHGA